MSLSTRKCLILILFLVILIDTYDDAEARGGGRGGGRGGSRGGSRSRSGSSRSGISSRTRSAVNRYTGPKYKSSMWGTGMAVGYLYGYSSYRRRRLYTSNPNKEPTVCFNAVKPKPGGLAYFICPEQGQSDSYVYCCGEEGDQRCCTFWDDGGRVAGVVIGIIAGIVVLIIVLFCVCRMCIRSRKMSRKRNSRDDSKVSSKRPGETYIHDSTAPLPTERNQYSDFPLQNTYTEMQPMAHNPTYGFKVALPPEEDAGRNRYNSPGYGFAYDEPDMPPTVHGYQSAGSHPMPSGAPPPYSGNSTSV